MNTLVTSEKTNNFFANSMFHEIAQNEANYLKEKNQLNNLLAFYYNEVNNINNHHEQKLSKIQINTRIQINQNHPQSPKVDINSNNRELYDNNHNQKSIKSSKKKKSFSEREGDWTCFDCKNLNFSFRKRCNRCNILKEISDKKHDDCMEKILNIINEHEKNEYYNYQ